MNNFSCRIIFGVIPGWIAFLLFGGTLAVEEYARTHAQATLEVVCVDDAMETGGRYIYLPENSLKGRGE